MKKHVYHIDQVAAQANGVVLSANLTLDTEKFGYFIVLWIRRGNVIQVVRKSYLVTGDDLASVAAHDDFEALKALLLGTAPHSILPASYPSGRGCERRSPSIG